MAIKSFWWNPKKEKRYWGDQYGIKFPPKFARWLYPKEIEKIYEADDETKYTDWIKLNFGVCMGMHFRGFINIDARPQMNPDILWSLEGGLPPRFKVETIDYIFSSLLIDKLSYAGTHKLLVDCYRVLKKGHVIRTLVPDIEVMKYQRDSGEWKNNRWVNIEPWKNFIKTAEQYYDYTTTKWCNVHLPYDEAGLIEQLVKGGFNREKIRRCCIREGKHPKLCMECIDAIPRLILEAEK